MGNKYPSFLCINIGLVYVCIRIKLLADIIARYAVTNLLLIKFLTVQWPGSHITQPTGCSYIYTYMYRSVYIRAYDNDQSLTSTFDRSN